ncbi:MAG: TatD family hydrolase [Bacteroidales bacterium]
MLIDTHTHLYLEEYKEDRKEVIKNAIDKHVKYMLLPSIDSDTIEAQLLLCKEFPKNCFPMAGLHPTSVKENYKEELKRVEQELEKKDIYIGIGEIGIDLYWDKTYAKEQKIALRHQLELAVHYDLPVAIHSRESFPEIFNVIDEFNNPKLKGIFHCFSGDENDAKRIIDWGFKMGIGGVLTFKKSNLPEIVKNIDLKHLVLETDSPFLTPMPFRGKRNQSAYVTYIAQKMAEIKECSLEEVAKVTSNNALELFQIEDI